MLHHGSPNHSVWGFFVCIYAEDRRGSYTPGMTLEEAMNKWQTMDQLPAEYRS